MVFGLVVYYRCWRFRVWTWVSLILNSSLKRKEWNWLPLAHTTLYWMKWGFVFCLAWEEGGCEMAKPGSPATVSGRFWLYSECLHLSGEGFPYLRWSERPRPSNPSKGWKTPGFYDIYFKFRGSTWLSGFRSLAGKLSPQKWSRQINSTSTDWCRNSNLENHGGFKKRSATYLIFRTTPRS